MDLLAAGDEQSLRCASLELGYYIEYLLLDRLRAYIECLDDAAMSKWTPKQILLELLNVDPDADKTLGREHRDGEPAKEMHLLGDDRRLKLKWANVNWNPLSNFLHAPTLEQLKAGKALTVETMKKRMISRVICKRSWAPRFPT